MGFEQLEIAKQIELNGINFNVHLTKFRVATIDLAGVGSGAADWAMEGNVGQ